MVWKKVQENTYKQISGLAFNYILGSPLTKFHSILGFPNKQISIYFWVPNNPISLYFGVSDNQVSKKYFLDAILNFESKIGCGRAHYKVLIDYQLLLY